MRIVAILVPAALLGALLWYFAATRALFALAPIQDFAGFGQTTAQCATVYGHANIILNSKKYVSPQTRGYVKGGLSLLVGFDEQGRAEQFVISKSELFRTSDFSEQERKNLLDHFKEGSS